MNYGGCELKLVLCLHGSYVMTLGEETDVQTMKQVDSGYLCPRASD
jgi:hypothetical protein